MYLNLAQAHLQMGHPERALRACEVVRRDDSKNQKALYRSAEAFFVLGKNEEAESTLRLLSDSESGAKLAAALRQKRAFEFEQEKKRSTKAMSALFAEPEQRKDSHNDEDALSATLKAEIAGMAAPLAGSQQFLQLGEEIRGRGATGAAGIGAVGSAGQPIKGASVNYRALEERKEDATDQEIGDHFIRRALAQSKRYQSRTIVAFSRHWCGRGSAAVLQVWAGIHRESD